MEKLKGDKRKMNRKTLSKEWQRLNFELLENKPKIETPYPPDIVKRRELLLLAQVHLNNILGAMLEKDMQGERFETEMYHKIMDFYYEWNRN